MDQQLKKVMLLFAAVAIAILVCCFVSCKTPAPILQDNTTNTRTTIIEEDSAATIPGDRAWAKLYLMCDSIGNVLIYQLEQEQGQRIAIEAELQHLRDLFHQQQQDNNKETNQPTPPTQNTNTANNIPNLSILSLECKEDSLQIIINEQRVLIEHYEAVSKTETKVQEVVPIYYRNCTRGFWVLLVANVLILAFLLWRKWGNIRGFFLNLLARLL